MPVIKSRYNFDISPNTGREYLVSQDLFDSKGLIKSTGLFADNGNKSGEIKYFYDATGALQRKEHKTFDSGKKEITFYQQNKAVKTEFRTKGDSLLYVDEMKYNEKGHLAQKTRLKGGATHHQWTFDYQYDSKGNIIQKYEFETDSSGQMMPAVPKLYIMEYDNSNMILQTTVYNNKEKRKMLSWVYYKYQLDNDYRIIRQTGFNDEQVEIHSKEITYNDTSVTYVLKQAPEGSKKPEFVASERWVYNEFGEPIKKYTLSADGTIIKSELLLYDQYGNVIENLYQTGDNTKKVRTIYEYYTDQASKAK
jgi:hypothetical protein